jgi:hypothetical protein
MTGDKREPWYPLPRSLEPKRYVANEIKIFKVEGEL